MAEPPRFQLHMDFTGLSQSAAERYVKQRKKMTHLVVNDQSEAAYLSGHMAGLMGSTVAYTVRGLATIFADYTRRLPQEVTKEELIYALETSLHEFAALLEGYDFTKV